VIETHSETWVTVKDWAQAELDRARNNLESTGLDMIETENLRGRAAALRQLLSLAVPRPVIAAQDVSY